MTRACHVRFARWPDEASLIRQVRETVFIREQQVPPELEWDGIDPECVHVLALDEQGQAIGTGRLLADGHIGRMAVLQDWRGQGVGSQIIQLLMQQARDNAYPTLQLNAQVSAVPFYEQFGFHSHGEVFDDAGIPHLKMVFSD